MRVYLDESETAPVRIVCNQCKKEMLVENNILKEGCFSADISFGYFSDRDGVRHRFDLCEVCYNKMIQGFEIPVEEIEMKELL